ncbi:MAG TPA: LPS export ABC transporter permease LptF [Povalibacter sp.]|uniref:LPS export ABC transporter permease LptF n=1 Tax=Povalibacter sp. TaxID=1962978 RepID=UPI002C3E7C43|nr:LPS export ABC transporter permease LptF [Povalibacter sp.]HMN43446.1 LPS export ABC transporter permease LptF [Povalibacter sp.]
MSLNVCAGRTKAGDCIRPVRAEVSALRTLDRYVFREVAVTWLAVTVVLLAILLANQLARVLSQAAANDFPREVVFALIGLTTTGNLSIIMPIGFFLAIMLALGRLYHESEMAAIQACGVGPAGLFRPITLLGIVIVALLAWLSFIAIPAASARAQAIRAEALRDAQFGLLEPGRFRTFGGGNIVFYAERVDENGILHNVNVFIERPVKTDESGDAREVQPASRFEIWTATRAEQRGAGQAEQTFVLYDGERYEGVPGEGQFRIIRFSEGGIPIRLGDPAGRASKADMKLTAELLDSTDLKDVAELHWRIATPVSALVLMMLAVPLARLRPRQGRFGRMGIAILAYFIYYNSLVAARTWIENGVAPQSLGLWWVHVIALVAAALLLLRAYPIGRVRPAAVS